MGLGYTGEPEVGTVVTINADVTEWAGNKQLTISSISRSTKGPEEFAPKGDFDIDDYKAKLNMLLLNMENVTLKNLVTKIFDDYLEQWKQLLGDWCAPCLFSRNFSAQYRHSNDCKSHCNEHRRM